MGEGRSAQIPDRTLDINRKWLKCGNKTVSILKYTIMSGLFYLHKFHSFWHSIVTVKRLVVNKTVKSSLSEIKVKEIITINK